ncbi:hypothetical protein GCM10027347_57740 [Larkinella harenae]
MIIFVIIDHIHTGVFQHSNSSDIVEKVAVGITFGVGRKFPTIDKMKLEFG